MAVGLVFEEFPEFAGSTVEIPDHAWFFRFGVRGDIARTRVKSRTTGHGYICIRQVIEISTIVNEYARICAPA